VQPGGRLVAWVKDRSIGIIFEATVGFVLPAPQPAESIENRLRLGLKFNQPKNKEGPVAAAHSSGIPESLPTCPEHLVLQALEKATLYTLGLEESDLLPLA
jgi:hypothetical protein